MLFDELTVWHDSVPRSGPENMRLDRELLKLGRPVLRFYDWEGAWASYGYFQSEDETRAEFGVDVNLVRRWTGGGMVDHRADQTYTLAIPPELAKQWPRAESYRLIHEALVKCLNTNGIKAELAGWGAEEESGACFKKPVCWDVMSNGQKIAGAAQRRTRDGLLHQGSVIGEIDGFENELTESVLQFSAD